MATHNNSTPSLIDRFIQTISNRAQTNTVLLVAALVTGTTAYIAILMSAWFSMFEHSDAVVASLGVAIIAVLTTLLLVAYRSYHDSKKLQKQAELQSQVLTNLLYTAVGAVSKSKLSVAPMIALAGLALTSNKKQNRSQRQLSK